MVRHRAWNLRRGAGVPSNSCFCVAFVALRAATVGAFVACLRGARRLLLGGPVTGRAPPASSSLFFPAPIALGRLQDVLRWAPLMGFLI